MAEARDFKFGTQLGFIKPHHKISSRRKVGVALGYGNSPKFGITFNISILAEASDFKFGTQLGFAKSNHKITPKGESSPRLGSSQKFGVPLQYLYSG